MADGVAIQDRDLFAVPSTRRNPLLADIFERLCYMERKGSGFGKIVDSYEFQVNYTEDKKPVFRSDRASFFVIMPNLNYDAKDKMLGTQGGTQGMNFGTQEVLKDKLEARLLQLIMSDKKISIR